MNESKRYDALDGVRVLAMTGILVMHTSISFAGSLRVRG